MSNGGGSKLFGAIGACGILFAALTWASNANVPIGVIELIENILSGWKDFFRYLWRGIFDWINFPFHFEDHQIDAINFIVFISFGGIFRVILAINQDPLWSLAPHTEHEWPWHYYVALYGRIVVFAIILILIQIPFIDTFEFGLELAFVFLAPIIVLYASIGVLLMVGVIYLFSNIYISFNNFSNSVIGSIDDRLNKGVLIKYVFPVMKVNIVTTRSVAGGVFLLVFICTILWIVSLWGSGVDFKDPSTNVSDLIVSQGETQNRISLTFQPSDFVILLLINCSLIFFGLRSYRFYFQVICVGSAILLVGVVGEYVKDGLLRYIYVDPQSLPYDD